MSATLPDTERIQPYANNRFYWQYKGAPTLLLGGSVKDCLYQVPNLQEELDRIADAGGNYVRCTMACRNLENQPYTVWPFLKNDDGLYDMNQWNPEWLDRFAKFLKMTAERDIIVQIEVWATFDYYRNIWAEQNPFNPANNCNYSATESKLPEIVDSHPIHHENPFFWSVPNEHNNEIVLGWQRKFVDKMLEMSLDYGHVLYCMDNETSVTPEWGWYWSQYIQAAAKAKGVSVETTEMWDKHELAHAQHANTFDHPEIYSFVDISQNNHQQHHAHWANAQAYREKIIASGNIRPINSIKIYGANTGYYGSDRDAIERFWRNILGGLASSRFHRPASGLGSTPRGLAAMTSARMMLDEYDIFTSQPHYELLSWQSYNEAYAAATLGEQYVVFCPDGGMVRLDVSSAGGAELKIRWLDCEQSVWIDPLGEPQYDEDGKLMLNTPDQTGYWIAVIKPE